MSSRVVSGFCVVVFGAGIAFAQEAPKPGPEHQRLKKMEGTWDAVMDMNGQKSKGKATYKSICGGMWLESDFEGEFFGAPYFGHGVDGYDLNKNKYVSFWFDSMGSAPMPLEGEFDEATKKLTMTGQTLGPDGQMHGVKTVTEHKDDDHMTFQMFMVEADGTEQLQLTIDYARSGKAKAAEPAARGSRRPALRPLGPSRSSESVK